MKRTTLHRVAAVSLFGMLSVTGAQAAGDTDANVLTIRKAISRATGLAPDKIQPSTTLPGYYEVEVKGALAYVDPAGKRLIRGDVVDLATGENLTASRLTNAPTLINPKELPVADALKSIAGSGRRELFVFVDPNCSFCKQLEPELAKLKDVTVHRFILAVLGPGSQAKAKQVWCAPNRDLAWANAMNGKSLDESGGAACDDSAINRNMELARKLGIRATPTIVFSSGERVAAVMTSTQLEERMGAKVALTRQAR